MLIVKTAAAPANHRPNGRASLLNHDHAERMSIRDGAERHIAVTAPTVTPIPHAAMRVPTLVCMPSVKSAAKVTSDVADTARAVAPRPWRNAGRRGRAPG